MPSLPSEALHSHLKEIDRRLRRVESMSTASHLRLLILRRILLDRGLLDSETFNRIWREAEDTAQMVLMSDGKTAPFQAETEGFFHR